MPRRNPPCRRPLPAAPSAQRARPNVMQPLTTCYDLARLRRRRGSAGGGSRSAAGRGGTRRCCGGGAATRTSGGVGAADTAFPSAAFGAAFGAGASAALATDDVLAGAGPAADANGKAAPAAAAGMGDGGTRTRRFARGPTNCALARTAATDIPKKLCKEVYKHASQHGPQC